MAEAPDWLRKYVPVVGCEYSRRGANDTFVHVLRCGDYVYEVATDDADNVYYVSKIWSVARDDLGREVVCRISVGGEMVLFEEDRSFVDAEGWQYIEIYRTRVFVDSGRILFEKDLVSNIGVKFLDSGTLVDPSSFGATEEGREAYREAIDWFKNILSRRDVDEAEEFLKVYQLLE